MVFLFYRQEDNRMLGKGCRFLFTSISNGFHSMLGAMLTYLSVTPCFPASRMLITPLLFIKPTKLPGHSLGNSFNSLQIFVE